ncbi:NAD-dependent epimerase/dehydratase family protein [Pedobacter sp. HDW13]|uniref:NAD-dependent epimerase/dehydratase family protein n=1 Tax=unclassified Pedobacter TaxID=2628915 RepID=UPI000F59E41D|nr:MULTISPECIES: NAD-dependent epimerase/dehydratase family protein [unclassified Pedobacter]QIL39117.1 NAD-dependent epimerase/dehydratase family protein [Pedobacter sp. HDW13]RQO63914.1 epimerase [Pedobacter sp. KBW01]
MEKARDQRNVIITGATGMVGEGVLMRCLESDQIDTILVINRKPCGYAHPKLKEIIHADFLDFSAIENQLSGYNACFFCLGISSVGVDADVYYKMTYTLTMHVAETLSKLNNNMTFCYVSGGGTNENGRLKWAQVKGKTENDLMKLPFDQVFNFRPGFIKPLPGQKYAHKFYKYINWMFPIGRALYASGFCTMAELSNAMIHTLNHQNERRILEGKDIIAMAKE